jgi:ABC-2 type transport system ATP-binding protein/ribosome-dependent ATPase
MRLVEVSAARKRFGEVAAVDGVDLAVRSGEVVGLLGANGAGKTTLMRLILGLLQPTGGTISLFGEPPSRRTRARLGYLPQSLGLYEDLTVAENLTFSAGAFGAPAPQRLDPALEAVGGELVASLPLGLRRRVAFAAALAHHPDLLVLDEPTSGVDPLGRARLWETIWAAAAAGAGVLVSTHFMSEAEQCDRLVIMAAGRVVASGGIADIVGQAITVEVRPKRWEAAFTALERAGLPAALVGRRLRVPHADPRRVAAALSAARVAAGVDLVPATLEETFVALSQHRGGSGAHPPDHAGAA